jgi:DNA ligase-1
METLYQLDSAGKVKVWTIEVLACPERSDIVVQSGKLGGKLITNTSSISEGKNQGRSNETTHWEQAVSEMESTIKLKLKKGYVHNLLEVKSSSVLGSGVPAPMLAQKYDRTGKQKGSKTLAQLKLLGKEIIIQPKLDGNRCMIKIENGIGTMYTRSGDIMPVQLHHILKTIPSDIPDMILDGELFSNKISFNKLNGLIKREKASYQDVEDRKEIKFHLYDVMTDAGYEVRSHVLPQFASAHIIIVPSFRIRATEENIQAHLEQFLSEGHEGLMIRQLGIGYENKRTWQLCKVKVFEDSEYLLVGFEEESRGGFVGAFVMQDPSGKTFNAGASGQSEDERRDMWRKPEHYIGKMATVEYFGFSEYGVPRFPKFKGIR